MLKTSRPVSNDPLDQNRYCAEEFGAVVALDGSDPERERNWRRWCWYLASLDGFPSSHSKDSGEVVHAGKDAWTIFCQHASLNDLADAMINRHDDLRRAGPRKERAA